MLRLDAIDVTAWAATFVAAALVARNLIRRLHYEAFGRP
jgi:hypothetical protein